jgi:hypothetical protein
MTLVDAAKWAWVEENQDPFARHRPQEVSCPEEAYGFEDFAGQPAFEVNTRYCNYLTVRQPTSATFLPGDTLHLRIWHFRLTSAEPAEAHLAVQVADRLVWEERVAIPSDSNVVRADVPMDFGAPKGVPVYFHLHNHGENSWHLLEMMIIPPEGE